MGNPTRKPGNTPLPETTKPRRVQSASAPSRRRSRLSLHTLAPQLPHTNGHLPEKARVAPALARVAAPTPHHHTDPLATKLITLDRTKKRSGHTRQPLFVLGTVRRRRARGNGPRGGYYALSITRKPRGIPRPISWLLSITGAFLLFILLSMLTLGATAYGAYAYFAKDLPP